MKLREIVRNDLLRQKKRLENQLAEGEQEDRKDNLKDNLGELSLVDNHPADVGSENYERSKDLSLKEKNNYLLKRIERALAKIEEGSYGLCERCGESISTERLAAVPYTLYCIVCQEKVENQYPNDRPVEEDTIGNPFVSDRMKEEARTDIEDFWQEVAGHNKRRRIFEDSLEDEETGKVESTDSLSNEEYRDQLPE